MPVTFEAVLGVASARLGCDADAAAVANVRAAVKKVIKYMENMAICMSQLLRKGSSSWSTDYVKTQGAVGTPSLTLDKRCYCRQHSQRML